MCAPHPAGRELAPEAWHERLVALVRRRARARVELGRMVDELARRSGHHEMGYSSLGAWALQRTGLSPRFVQESRSMARRLFQAPGLPRLCEALCHGRVSWSAAARVASVLARCAKEAPERLASEELAAVEVASSMTVRCLEAWLVERRKGWDESSEPESGEAKPNPKPNIGPEVEAEPPDRRLLERSIDGIERELIEATRKLITLMDGPVSDEQFAEALLAEAHDSMLNQGTRAGAGAGPGRGLAFALQLEASGLDWAAAHSDVIEAYADARRRADESTAAATEARVERLRAQRGDSANAEPDTTPEPEPDPIIWDDLRTLTLADLDARIVALAGQIAERDLAVADAALAVAHTRGWRRLGWRNQEEYAREELGLSASSLRAIIARARTMIELPELRVAVEAGRIGLEAAATIGRVATPDTVERWVEHAQRRTVVHLREETRVVELLARSGTDGELATDLGPPSPDQIEAVRDFERSVASGDWFEELMASVGSDGQDRQMCGPPDLDPGRRLAPRRADLIFSEASGLHSDRLRLRISDEQAGYWRYLERAYNAHERGLRRSGAEPVSFIAFACIAVWMTWMPSIRATGQYDRWTEVYVRDRYECSSPVCTRRDVTPHHLRYQAHGGGDEAENVAGLCSWCHLEGIHGGRITALPPASAIHWRLGRGGGLEVRGRELVTG